MKADSVDRLPWYRHRWPWLLMAGPAVVVVAGLATAWIAATTHDGLVAEDYYKQGLGVNQRLAREERAAAMGLEGRLRLTAERAELRLDSRTGAALPAHVRLVLAHPTRSGADRAVLLTGREGVYSALLVAPGPGRWQATVEDEAATWRVSGSLRLPDVPEAMLGAGGRR